MHFRRSVPLSCCGFALHPASRVWPIYAVLLGVGMGRAFSGPASSALLPSLVPRQHFVNAITWGAIVFQVANIAGPAVGGLLFTLSLTRSFARFNGAALVYTFSLVTLLAFLALVGTMRTRPVRVVKNAFNLETMLAGFKYVWHAKLLLGSISLDLFAVLLGGATALLAHLRDRYPSRRTAGAWPAPRHARCRRSSSIAYDDSPADQA